jgi:hypothetical protein
VARLRKVIGIVRLASQNSGVRAGGSQAAPVLIAVEQLGKLVYLGQIADGVPDGGAGTRALDRVDRRGRGILELRDVASASQDEDATTALGNAKVPGVQGSKGLDD